MLTKEHLHALETVARALSRTQHPHALKQLRRITDKLLQESPKAQMSAVASRILLKCAGQVLTAKTIARVCGYANNESTPLREALKLLVSENKIERIGAGKASQYKIPPKVD
jgi:cytochrome P450